MLKVRVMPTLLYQDHGLVKSTGFDNFRRVGAATQALRVYNLRQVDELVFLDITNARSRQPPDFALIDELADECFMPLTVGGGVNSVEDVRGLLMAGADKVAIGTACVTNPQLVQDASRAFGVQCITASIDYRITSDGPRVFVKGGTENTGLDPLHLAKMVEMAGAGEILLTSIDRDGRMNGYDLSVLSDVSHGVGIPVIANGGCGSADDMVKAVLDGGAAAVAAASLFHFTERTPKECKHALRDAGIAVRFA